MNEPKYKLYSVKEESKDTFLAISGGFRQSFLLVCVALGWLIFITLPHIIFDDFYAEMTAACNRMHFVVTVLFWIGFGIFALICLLFLFECLFQWKIEVDKDLRKVSKCFCGISIDSALVNDAFFEVKIIEDLMLSPQSNMTFSVALEAKKGYCSGIILDRSTETQNVLETQRRLGKLLNLRVNSNKNLNLPIK